MLIIEHLTKQYKGSNKGIRDLSLHVEPGDIYAFIGHNGAGKTTTLKCVAGIQDYDAGAIRIGGKDLLQDPLECKRMFAYIPDNPDVYEYLTGIQYLNFIADVFRVPAGTRRERIQKYGNAFEITPSLGDLVSTYSHGMKQKLAILSALVHQPGLLILDEPFVGLDPKASVILKNIMQEICDGGGAILFSTHVLDVAQRLCNKVAIIREGKLVTSGSMEQVLRQGESLAGEKSLEDIFMEVAGDVR
ncbi:MAG: ABC transporter ATP-binding protein [Lachnospiraceae bacterium]|nr:ABC transporter ATP-binding protein [Lachnospiraceae bacterium]